MAGTNPNYVAKEDKRTVDRQSPKCDEKAARRRKMGARKKCTTFVGQTKRSVGAVAKKKARKSTGRQIPELLGTWDKASKGDKRWQRGITSHHPLCESGWRRSHQQSESGSLKSANVVPTPNNPALKFSVVGEFPQMHLRGRITRIYQAILSTSRNTRGMMSHRLETISVVQTFFLSFSRKSR